MKKILGLVLTLSLVLCGLPFSSNAEVVNTFEFSDKTVEIIYTSNTLSSDKIDAISKFVVDDTIVESTTYGILCIFGHKLEYSDVTTIEHNYYTTSPYCRKTIYQVETCARESCSYMNKTIISQTRFAGCHG